MKTPFTPIAMRCNKEQFDAISKKLIDAGVNVSDISNFDAMPYLINFRFSEEKNVTNYPYDTDWEKWVGIKISNVYKVWDEALFLKSCGIDVEPSYTVPKEFILEAHKESCSTWKSKIEKQFPELFECELEVGKWYNYNGALCCYQGDENGFAQAYGIRIDKTWFSVGNCGNLKHLWKLATPQEIESALIEEAKRRGFKEGVSVKCIKGISQLNKLWLEACVFFEKGNSLETWKNNSCHNTVLFKNGTWAEIIKETEVKQSELEKFYKEQKGIDNLKVLKDV